MASVAPDPKPHQSVGTDSRQPTALEDALAHNNGIELLNDVNLVADLEKGGEHAIAHAWFQAFTDVHKRLFSSRSFNHDDEKPGIIQQKKGGNVERILSTLVKQLYNEQGFAKKLSRKEIASFLSDAYIKLHRENPFKYGEDLSLRTFFALIGKTKALTDKRGIKLDINFMRLTPEDFKTLELPPDKPSAEDPKKSNQTLIDAVFVKLLNPKANPRRRKIPAEYDWKSLPSSETEISEKHFLSHTTRNHTKCLVTINGGLVRLDDVDGKIRQHIERDGHPVDFTVRRNQIIGYLIEDGRDDKDRKSIDGIPFETRSKIDGKAKFEKDERNMFRVMIHPDNPEGPVEKYLISKNAHLIVHDGDRVTAGQLLADDAIPLFPLNVDLLTGLDVTTQLPTVKDYCKAHNTHILRLPEYVKNHELPDNLKSRLLRAARRVEGTREIVWKSIDKAFEGTTPLARVDGEFPEGKPNAYMTMGGTGSGKSNLETIAREHTNNNLVKASLDDARACFQVYDLYAAVGNSLPNAPEPEPGAKPVRTGHHSDDYMTLETAAGYIREGIVWRAKGNEGDYERLALPQKKKSAEKPAGKKSEQAPQASPAPEEKKEKEKEIINLYHLLYDGSGIPYETKNKEVIQGLSDKGFKAHVWVADAPIHIAYDRAKRRLEGVNGRAVPPKVIADKHRNEPRAMRDAVRDEHVKDFVIIDTTNDEIGTHYTLARRVSLKADDKAKNQVKVLEKARRIAQDPSQRNPRALYDTMKEMGLLPEEKDTKYAPEGWQDRVEFFVVSHDHHFKMSEVLIITDHERMTKISRKGALNPDASGLKDLHTLRQPFEIMTKSPKVKVRDR